MVQTKLPIQHPKNSISLSEENLKLTNCLAPLFPAFFHRLANLFDEG